MKSLNHLISISVLFCWVMVSPPLVRSQTGNMSDVTGPNPIDMINPDTSNGDPEPPDPTLIPPDPDPDPIGDNPNPTDPTAENPNPTDPTAENPDTTDPTAENPDTTDPTAENPDTTDPTAENPDTTDPTAENPDTTDTDTAQEGETQDETATSDTETSDTETSDTETEDTAEDTKDSEEVADEPDFEQEIDSQAYEVQLQQSTPDLAILMQEESYATQISSYAEFQIYGEAPSVQQISQRLGELWLQTGKKTAFISISLQRNQLESFTVLPNVSSLAMDNSEMVSSNIANNQLVQASQTTLRNTITDSSRKRILATAKKFREEISNPRKVGKNDYLIPAQQLYEWIIAPLEPELEKYDIDVLVFAMDSGLRLLPLAALHDGEQFLIEKYAIALVPSFGLTDTRYVNLNQSTILAMGASRFKGEVQSPLPTMPIELETITHNASRGQIYLNEDFTVANFKAQNRLSHTFSIIHLGTHANFRAGNFDDSYIQFYDEKLQLSALREISDELGWSNSKNPPVELLVLSACETALGDEKAELGFAGLALQAGVKSALASLWYVSDLGTLALMGEFYNRLDDSLIKAEALRQTQLNMLTGKVMVQDKHIILSNGESLPLPDNFPDGSLILDNPYFWSSFTLIGNWN
ncbi:MAG: CHAT domain-containing protein [Xenococcaceae cyanobacterium MO_207.B15]|nr:CHAT domain-containing protein [Xenococcaceae cyanobacterium MO_207.B15]